MDRETDRFQASLHQITLKDKGDFAHIELRGEADVMASVLGVLSYQGGPFEVSFVTSRAEVVDTPATFIQLVIKTEGQTILRLLAPSQVASDLREYTKTPVMVAFSQSQRGQAGADVQQGTRPERVADDAKAD